MARLAIAAVTLMIVTACGAVPRSGAPEGVIPWLALPAVFDETPQPAPQPYSVPAGMPACTASQLLAVALEGEGAGGRFFTSVAFAGATAQPCFLEGVPTVRAFGAGEKPIDVKQQPAFGGSQGSGPALIEPVPLPFAHETLKYGQAALTVDWDTQPEACAGSGGSVIHTLEISIPAGGTLRIPIPVEPAAYPCAGLGVGGFQAALQPVDVTAIPPEPDPPAIALQAASSAVAGANFKYVVTVTNASKTALNLVATCPNYEEELFADLVRGSPPLGGKHIFQLNCQPAGTLEPGEKVDFEMVFPVPPDAAPGGYTLMFAIGYTNAMTRTLEQPLTITA